MNYKFRVFEDYGIFISIKFARNLNRKPAWMYIIEDVEDCLFTSGRIYDFNECELTALKKACEYI